MVHGSMLSKLRRSSYYLAFKCLVRCALFLFFPLQARAHKISEERVRTSRTALKLRMELRSDEPGMMRQFDDLYQAIISRATANLHTMRFHTFTIFVVEFITMTVALKHDGLTVGFIGPSARGQATHPVPQTHCTTFIRHLPLGRH